MRLSIKGSTASVLLALLSAVLACRAEHTFCGAFAGVSSGTQCVTEKELFGGEEVAIECQCTGGYSVVCIIGVEPQPPINLDPLPAPGCVDGTFYFRSTLPCDSACIQGGRVDGGGYSFCPGPAQDGSAGVCGDPHFYGFDSSDWDFQGEVNATYSLVSGADTQVNARFVLRDSRYDPVRGWYRLNQFKEVSTWVGGIGVRHKNDVVVVEKLEDMSVVVQANGRDVPMDVSVQLRDGVIVHLKNVSYAAGERRTNLLNGFKADEGYTTLAVIITLPSLVIQAELPPTFSRRMDLSMALNAPHAELAGQFEGMLGRTIRNVRAASPVITMEEEYPDTTWVIDIDEQREKLRYSATLEEVMISAYETTGLLEYDSATNRYKPTTSDDGSTGLPFTELPSSARRAMMEELNMFSGQKMFAGTFAKINS